MKPNLRVAVFGGRKIASDSYNQALELGRLLADEGWLVFCGGGSGAMEAVSRGVHEAGGTCIGILKGRNLSEANKWVTIPIATGIDISRNALLAYNCDVAIAINGSYGTLSEIAYGLQLGKPVFGLGTWEIPGVIALEHPVDIINQIKDLR